MEIPVQVRRIGASTVFPIGLGTMNLTHAYGRPPPPEQARLVLHRTLEVGVTHFDCAALYGFGRSEELLGEILKPFRSRIHLASKCGVTGVDGKRVIDGRPATLLRTLDDSLRRLGTEVIDLAGQKAGYLALQLKAFRSQTRGDPDAIGYMWGMASELDDATIDALAAYYSAQKAEPSATGHSAATGPGKGIYEQGVASEGVPACSTCHGPAALGTEDFPRLAGQHAQYVLKQLGSFQSNMRNVAIMHGVAQNLRRAEMQSVAAYLASLP